ncbi:MAG: DUF1987 domain-containing protein [Bacteroidales bacterium]|nr:DUF1987 domain-containing protein [Bacteroidales bacterium]
MFKPIILNKTEQTPEIILDKENNVFHVKGKSIILDALNFYTPILKWFKEYFENPNKTTELVFNIEYLNSPSSLQIIKIINLFELNRNKKNILSIKWLYNKEDERAKESGEEFRQLTEINFKLKSYNADLNEDFNFEI